MAKVVALIRIIPEPDSDIEEMKKSLKEKIPYGEHKIDVKEIAFGLKSLEITIKVPGDKGFDVITDGFEEVEGVRSVEVVQVGNIV